ncbi:MAG: Rhodopirellula transposase family protein, partial [Planctomycetaceae bacterium]|nr:Rhodopirellula transposase family protein [Planctomycetaceae bacterium]
LPSRRCRYRGSVRLPRKEEGIQSVRISSRWEQSAGILYNPIEHRFFPHVGLACQRKVFDTLETVVQLMRRTTAKTGLMATVDVIRRAYEIGRKVAQDFKANMTILFDELNPQMELQRRTSTVPTHINSRVFYTFVSIRGVSHALRGTSNCT